MGGLPTGRGFAFGPARCARGDEEFFIHQPTHDSPTRTGTYDSLQQTPMCASIPKRTLQALIPRRGRSHCRTAGPSHGLQFPRRLVCTAFGNTMHLCSHRCLLLLYLAPVMAPRTYKEMLMCRCNKYPGPFIPSPVVAPFEPLRTRASLELELPFPKRNTSSAMVARF
jgi:hypothetical protein